MDHVSGNRYQGSGAAMKILAFLQNPWFNEPEEVKAMLARHDADPERKEKVRRRLVAYALFAGCKTGRVLTKVFGERDIIWEESSLEIGGESASCFPADPEHMKRRIIEENPDVLILLGRIAWEGWLQLPADTVGLDCMVLNGPHPTARGDVLTPLREIEAAVQSRQELFDVEYFLPRRHGEHGILHPN